ncbi:MAG: SPFH domain-containing protein [Phycisphaerae bacterium]|jgi:regulator of protease activity HflC (stomatin/prohibitin superfamily)
MAELFHHHHPHHDHDDHGPTHDVSDPAAQSLANALRLSFRLLSVVMIVVLGFYLLTGVKTIQNSQVGIKKVFGKVVGLAKPGLAYTWPFPVGSIDIVNTNEQTLTIDDFWMSERPEEKAQPLLSRQYMGGGLQPGRDGALLTGDRNLLHIRLTCRYAIRDPLAFRTHVGNTSEGGDSAREVIRSALCRAAIEAAAVATADGLQRTDRNTFARAVQQGAQQELNALDSGIDITSVLLTEATWPLGSLQAYIAAQSAISQAERKKDAARAEAVQILSQAAGANYRRLVGDAGMEAFTPATAPAGEAAGPQGEDYNLIGQYAAARSDKNEPQAQALLQRIDAVLSSRSTSGEASKIISDAETARLAMIQRVMSRVNKFNQLLASYERTPELTLQNLWIAVREEILNSPTVSKFYLTEGDGKTVLKLNQDPEILNEVLRAMKAEKGKKDSQQP